MSSIPGVPITDQIVPTDSADTYPTHEDLYGRGGLMALPPGMSRTDIPADRRKVGMLVREGATTYRLTDLPATWQALPDELALVDDISTAQSAADAAQAAADAAQQIAVAAEAEALAAAADASAAVLAAAGAAAVASAAAAAAAGFPVADFRGTITALGDDPGAAASYSGKWWQIGVAGTLAHANAGGLTVAIGDRLLSNGTAWQRYIQPPTYLPADYVTPAQVSPTARSQWGDMDASSEYRWALVDEARKLALGIREDNTLIAKLGIDVDIANGLTLVRQDDGSYKLNLGTAEGEIPVGSGAISERGDLNEMYAWIVHDNSTPERLWIYGTADGTVRIPKLSNDEITNARGSRSTISERLSVGIDSFGAPIAGDIGGSFLREIRRRLYEIAVGDTTQCVVACVGDSWTHGAFRYTLPLRQRLKAVFGDAGAGWSGFGQYDGGLYLNGAVDTSELAAVFSSGWAGTSLYNASASPDLGAIETSTPGSTVTLYLLSGSATTVVLHFARQSGGGTVRYRFGSGSWTSIDTTGTGYATASLSGVPAGTWTLTLDCVSGPLQLYGVDVQKIGAGVRIHKLGGTGSTAAQWVAVNAASWQAGLTALGPHLVTVLLGTNDQATYTEDAFRANLETLIGRIRSAVPAADVLLVAPAENGLGRSTPMSDYARAMRRLASEFSAGFLDLQHSFGLVPADYAHGSARPLFHTDLAHPNDLGGRAITAAIYRLIAP